MVDTLLQIGAAKLVVSAMLAGVAWVVQRRVGNPAMVHPLWLLVLVALLLPAVVALPVLPSEGAAYGAVSANVGVAGEVAERVEVRAPVRRNGGPGIPVSAWITEHGRTALATVWLVVAAGLFGWTLVRALRFRLWLAGSSRPAPSGLRREVAEIGHGLGLARMPEVHTTTARVSPMVCWMGGRVRLVIPSFLLASLDQQELRAVLAHEVAHVRRRDHHVRWIEWLACSAFWWNPVAWWARRELRASEEASCDALGAASVGSTPRDYARSLLEVLDVMSTAPTPPPPTFSSGVTSGRSSDSLERRLRILVTGGSSLPGAPRCIRVAGALTALCLLPLGLVHCGTVVPTTPTDQEGSPESLPIAAAELIAMVNLNRTDPRAAELNELWGDDPEYSYWVFNSENGDVGPLPLADAPGQPVACRLVPRGPDESARDVAMGACTVAMSNHFRQTGGSDGGNVCVVWGSRASDWSGYCYGQWLRERYREQDDGAGGAPRELVVIHIRATQAKDRSER